MHMQSIRRQLLVRICNNNTLKRITQGLKVNSSMSSTHKSFSKKLFYIQLIFQIDESSDFFY